jgi:multiple sugar transport system permease protein
MLGYALAKLEFWGKNKLLLLVLATVMVPGSVLLVPQFVLIAKLDLVNTFAALILPTAVGAFGVFLMRQAMQSIPDELLEAGRIDGAGEFFLFFRVVLPLVVPTLATLGILTFLGSWNNFLWPLVVSTDEEKYTLPVALAIFTRGEYQADYGLLMAGSVVLVLPVLVLFILLQRYFRQGIATTGLKG